METTIAIIGYILGLYRDNGKENGNYYLGFSGDTSPEPTSVTWGPTPHCTPWNSKP